MAPPKPSTATLNTYADPPSDSETSPTTSPVHSSKPEDSNPNYTPNYEEPVFSPYLYVTLLEKDAVSTSGTVTFKFCDGGEQTIATSS